MVLVIRGLTNEEKRSKVIIKKNLIILLDNSKTAERQRHKTKGSKVSIADYDSQLPYFVCYDYKSNLI